MWTEGEMQKNVEHKQEDCYYWVTPDLLCISVKTNTFLLLIFIVKTGPPTFFPDVLVDLWSDPGLLVDLTLTMVAT